MTTLTQFIDTTMIQKSTTAIYEVIENEIIKASDLNDLTVSGSLFSLTTFTGVTFKSCVFFGSRFENCNFVDCNFVDCKFEFTHILNCNFNSTKFENCTYDFSTVSANAFIHSRICFRTYKVQSKGLNKIENCITPIMELDWEEALSMDAKNCEEIHSHDENTWGTTLLSFLKAA